jgi:hypothetical protein
MFQPAAAETSGSIKRSGYSITQTGVPRSGAPVCCASGGERGGKCGEKGEKANDYGVFSRFTRNFCTFLFTFDEKYATMFAVLGIPTPKQGGIAPRKRPRDPAIHSVM